MAQKKFIPGTDCWFLQENASELKKIRTKITDMGVTYRGNPTTENYQKQVVALMVRLENLMKAELEAIVKTNPEEVM